MTATPRFDPRTLGLELRPSMPGHSFQLPALPPALISQARETIASVTPRRTKIWELSKHFHCSIIELSSFVAALCRADIVELRANTGATALA
jgi:hypothetical protein